MTYPNYNLSSSVTSVKHSVFCNHYNLPVFHMSFCVFFALVHDFIIILLSNAEKLAIINNGPHDPFVEYFIQGWVCNTKAAIATHTFLQIYIMKSSTYYGSFAQIHKLRHLEQSLNFFHLHVSLKLQNSQVMDLSHKFSRMKYTYES